MSKIVAGYNTMNQANQARDAILKTVADGGRVGVLPQQRRPTAVAGGRGKGENPSLFFKLSHHVEIVESGGVQIETHYADITNPSLILGFDREQYNGVMLPQSARIDITEPYKLMENMGAGYVPIYVEWTYDDAAYVTKARYNEDYHPQERIGQITLSSVYQNVFLENILYLAPTEDYWYKPVMNNGSGAIMFIKPPPTTEYPFRPETITLPEDIVADKPLYACLEYISGSVYGDRTYSAYYAVDTVNDDYLGHTPTSSAALIYMGRIGAFCTKDVDINFKTRYIL